jgi:DHA2 family multidrug resistance protein
MFRIIQGIAGGGLISTGQAILIETWPREQIGTATALFGLGAVVGPTVGPTIGGWITEHYFVAVDILCKHPGRALAAFLTYTFITETPKAEKGKPVDWWGIGLLAVAVGSLQTILEKGESEDWFAKNLYNCINHYRGIRHSYCLYGAS